MKLNVQFHCILLFAYLYFVCSFQPKHFKTFLSTFSYPRQSLNIECEANGCKRSFVKCTEFDQTCFIACSQCSKHFNTIPFVKKNLESIASKQFHIISFGELLGNPEKFFKRDKTLKKRLPLKAFIKQNQQAFSQIRKKFKRKESKEKVKEEKKEEEDEDDYVLDYWNVDSSSLSIKKGNSMNPSDTKVVEEEKEEEEEDKEEEEEEKKKERQESIEKSAEIVPKFSRYKMIYKPNDGGASFSIPVDCLSSSFVNLQASIVLRPEGEQPLQTMSSACVIEGSFFPKTNLAGLGSSASSGHFFRFKGRLRSRNVFIIKTLASIEKRNIQGLTSGKLEHLLQEMLQLTYECIEVKNKICVFDHLKSYVSIGCARSIGWKAQQTQRLEKMIQYHNELEEKLRDTFKNSHETMQQLYQKELRRRNEILEEHKNNPSAPHTPEYSETTEKPDSVQQVSQPTHEMHHVHHKEEVAKQTPEEGTTLMSSKTEILISEGEKNESIGDKETKDLNGVITSYRVPYNKYKAYHDKYMRAKLYKLDD